MPRIPRSGPSPARITPPRTSQSTGLDGLGADGALLQEARRSGPPWELAVAPDATDNTRCTACTDWAVSTLGTLT
jgi:hypothetical protein